MTSITACERLMAMSPCAEPPREPSLLTATPNVGIGGWGDADDYEVVARYMSERKGPMALSAAVESMPSTFAVQDRAFRTVRSSTLKIPQKRPLEPLPVSCASTSSPSPKPSVFKEFDLNTARRASGRAGRAAACGGGEVVRSRAAWRSSDNAPGGLIARQSDVLPSLLPGRFFVKMDHPSLSKYRALSTDATVRPELAARFDAAAAAAATAGPVTPEQSVVHHPSGSPCSSRSPLSPQLSVPSVPHFLRAQSSLEFSSSTRECFQTRVPGATVSASNSSRSFSSLSPFMWERSEPTPPSSTTASTGPSSCSPSASLAANPRARVHALPQLAAPRVRASAKLLPALQYRATLRSSPMRAAQTSLPTAEPLQRRRHCPLSNVNVSSEYSAAAGATKSDLLMSEIRSLRSNAIACEI